MQKWKKIKHKTILCVWGLKELYAWHSYLSLFVSKKGKEINKREVNPLIFYWK